MGEVSKEKSSRVVGCSVFKRFQVGRIISQLNQLNSTFKPKKGSQL